MATKILVTGAGGFILSNFVRYVRQDYSNYIFSCIDNISSSKTLQTLYSNKGVDFHIADISDFKIIDRIFDSERPDYVIHGAVDYYNSNDIINTNIKGMQSLIESSVKFNVKKFIYLSDVSVYGDINCNCISESFVPNPNNLFSASKYSAEILLKSNTNLDSLILRISNVLGPRQMTNGFVPTVINKLLDNNLLIDNYNNSVKDWTHVQDVCSGMLQLIESDVKNDIFNISSGVSASNYKIINLISNALGKDFKILNIEDIKSTFIIDNSKIKSLGWKPEWKIEDAVYKTVEWYVKNSYFLK